ncbi:endonuclease/exonuclease/phosphatase family protein [Anianabacter salinae]|uniref:endonuclease/exonuclease/phosphatase family protein n=1 Tax=Anianabacter salinae TaxID=2851023 RepID=UPI00225E46C5|nr:endonuclease/exonuclease/phosphatase family protein [Anianabacter salinae]
MSSGISVHARPRDEPDRRLDRGKAAHERAGHWRHVAACLILLLWAPAAWGEPLRIATWHTELTRDGPGLLLADMADAPDVGAVVAVLVRVRPDIVLLTGVDWDAGLLAFRALADRLEDAGHPMPVIHAAAPNAGLATGLDMDGDGRAGTARDGQGYGRFHGHGAMVVLSRHPVDEGASRDLSALVWRDLPGAVLPMFGDAPFPSDAAIAIQRLSSVGHWDVAVDTPQGRVHLLALSATPPLFDGAEDRNGLRNAGEVGLWVDYLEGRLGMAPPDGPVVVLGNMNLDPLDGDGRRGALDALLSHPRLQDPQPGSDEGRTRAAAQGGANAGHRGDPALDTADWTDVPGPGNLRVSYILPDVRLGVADAGVEWTASDSDGARRHALVWVDLVLDP